MNSNERKQMMIEVGYSLAQELGHPNVVTFAMVAYKIGCSETLVKSYLINKSNLRAEILKFARGQKDQKMLAQAKALSTLNKKIKKS